METQDKPTPTDDRKTGEHDPVEKNRARLGRAIRK